MPRGLARVVPEWKYFEKQYSATGVDYGGTVVSLTDVPQGDTDGDRDGDALQAKRLEIRAYVSAGDAFNIVRVLLVKWHQNTALTGGSPTPGQIFQTITSVLAPQSPLVFDYVRARNFSVLRDWVVEVDTYNPVATINDNVDLGNYQLAFNAGTTTGTEKLFLVFISDSAAAPNPSVQFYTRLYFNDS